MKTDLNELFIQNFELVYQASKRLTFAHNKLNDKFPLDIAKLSQLSEDDLLNLDGFTIRFARLQDIVAKRVFRTLLEATLETLDMATFIDILNRLEQLKIIDSFDKWKEIRETRNAMVHDYTFSKDELIEILNTAFVTTTELIATVNRIATFAEQKLGLNLAVEPLVVRE
jgi:hypothetical protein